VIRIYMSVGYEGFRLWSYSLEKIVIITLVDCHPLYIAPKPIISRWSPIDQSLSLRSLTHYHKIQGKNNTNDQLYLLQLESATATSTLYPVTNDKRLPTICLSCFFVISSYCQSAVGDSSDMIVVCTLAPSKLVSRSTTQCLSFID